jgi:hypothetical protein
MIHTNRIEVCNTIVSVVLDLLCLFHNGSVVMMRSLCFDCYACKRMRVAVVECWHISTALTIDVRMLCLVILQTLVN